MTTPKATHTGILEIGNKKIPCAVLEDGTRVLSEHGITTAMGSRSGAAKRLKRTSDGPLLPVFVASKNLLPFINNDLMVGLTEPLKYEVSKGRTAQGFPAKLLPQICDVWLDAREAGALNKQQHKKCQQAEMLTRGLAQVGIIALVDEATGYQEVRDKLALQKILEKYLKDYRGKWAKTFPDEFYEHLFRLKGWQYRPLTVRKPSVVGHWTNDVIYSRLAPGVLRELRKRNPLDKAKGRRKDKHHQWLTDDYGHPALRTHLSNVVFLMKAAPNWGQFYRMLQRAAPPQERGADLLAAANPIPNDESRV